MKSRKSQRQSQPGRGKSVGNASSSKRMDTPKTGSYKEKKESFDKPEQTRSFKRKVDDESFQKPTYGEKPARSSRKSDNFYSSNRFEKEKGGNFENVGRKRNFNKQSDNNFTDKRNYSEKQAYNPRRNEESFVETRFESGVKMRSRKLTPSNTDYNPNDKYSKKKQLEFNKKKIDLNAPMRLNRFLANAGLCSRREADEYIAAGVVSVNGEIITEMGARIIPATDRILFHDQLVRSEKKVYLLLNKPKDCVTTTDDPNARLTVMDLVKNACSERIYPVGRLDRNTTGVLLLTNDGDMAARLTHPKYNKKKIYHVFLNKPVTKADMEKIAKGIILEDGEIHADHVEYVDMDDKKQVGIEIHSGRNRIVRRIFEHLGYTVVRLDRVYFAGLTKKKLARGKWRFLTEKEINILRMGAYE